jgi:hypothetical protein
VAELLRDELAHLSPVLRALSRVIATVAGQAECEIHGIVNAETAAS